MFQSLKGIRVNFGPRGRREAGCGEVFQSLKGIRVNFGLESNRGARWNSAFQSLKGIRVNFGSGCSPKNPEISLFQSLKGIRVNFGDRLRLLWRQLVFVSIPERDSGKFRGEAERCRETLRAVSIPERDSGKFRAPHQSKGNSEEARFQSLKGIRVNFGCGENSPSASCTRSFNP